MSQGECESGGAREGVSQGGGERAREGVSQEDKASEPGRE